MKLFKKYVARVVSLVALFLLSYIASFNDSIEAIKFESSIRWVSFSVSLLSIPWYNSKIYGVIPKDSSGWEKVYRLLLLPIPLVLVVVSRTYIPLALLLSLAIFTYGLRNKIVDKSLAKGITMSSKQSSIFFVLPVVSYIIFFFQPMVSLVIVIFVLTIVVDNKLLLNWRFLKEGYRFPSSMSKGLLIPILSILTLIAGNIDLLLIELISEKDSNIALVILYTKRLVLVVELLVLTLIQTSSLEDVRKDSKKLILVSLFITCLFILLVGYYLDFLSIKVYPKWFVFLFIVFNALKSLTILIERDLIESYHSLKRYTFMNLLLIFGFASLVIFADDIQQIMLMLLLFLVAQSVIRYVVKFR